MIKSSKPSIESSSEETRKILNYIENLKEEFLFKLSSMNKKMDILQAIINSIGGDES